jgi:hypothetical protein
MNELAPTEPAPNIPAFARLVERVSERRVVPFLGAGISSNATIPGDAEFQPKVWWMTEQLDLALKKELEALSGSTRETLEFILEPPHRQRALVQTLSSLFPETKPSEGKEADQESDKKEDCQKRINAIKDDCEEELADWLKQSNRKLDQLSDVYSWLAGAARLCKALRISDLTRLAPLPAHRYLAFLAREGLVNEIITTNYDTCIEQAYRHSFGPDQEHRANEALAVVFNLSHYRAHAGRGRTSSGEPVLHLYKINGDAEDLRAAEADFERHGDPHRLEHRAARIILSERQLQTFRDELWARDLYADRARSRSLFFCGFGSDEPQVRHHAMALMEEMQRQSQPAARWEDIAELPNAPFMAVYDELSFSQLQVLMGFTMAHAKPGTPIDGRRPMEAALANTLTAKLASFLRNEEKLSADLLIEHLFRAVWLRQLRDALEPWRTVDTWFRSLVTNHRQWIDWIRCSAGAQHTVDARDVRLGPACPSASNGHSPRDKSHLPPSGLADGYQGNAHTWLFGTTGEFLCEGTSAGAPGPMPLMNWVHCVLFAAPAPSGYYLPLRDNDLLIILTFLLCRWLSGSAHDSNCLSRIQEAPGIGLRIRIPRRATGQDQDQAAADYDVYLAREGATFDDLPAGVPPIVRVIRVPGRAPEARPADVRVAGRPVRPINELNQSAADLFRAARDPEADPLSTVMALFTGVHEKP